MTVLSNIDTAEYFKELLFYNNPIEKPKIKRLTDINLLISWIVFLWATEHNKNELSI